MFEHIHRSARGGASAGFTLLELLIVLVVIGILAGIAIPQFRDTKDETYASTIKSDIRNGVIELEMAYAELRNYSSLNGGDPESLLTSRESPGVDLTLPVVEAGGYCMQGDHVSLDESFGIAVGSAVPGITDASGDPVTDGVIFKGTCS